MVEARFALLTVDAHGVVPAVLADATSFIIAMNVNAGHVGSHFFIIDALIGMTITLACYKQKIEKKN